MAAITITWASACSTNGHVVLNVTGNKTATLRIHVDEVYQLPVDNDAFEAWLKQTLKFISIGKTKAQMRTALLAGITITI